MIKTKIYTKPKNTGASGGSTTRVTRLQGIATEAEYASKAGRASEADKAKEAGSAQYAEQAGHAGTAGYATKAGEVDLSAEALDHFARKDQDEAFKGKVGFKKDVNFEAAALFADEVTMLKKLKAQGGIETDYVRSANYDEDTQQGFGLSRTKNGGYRLSLSELEVWCKAIFHELEIRKLSYAGGNVYLSGAGSKIVKVVPVKWRRLPNHPYGGIWYHTSVEQCEGWKCYLLADDGTTATQNLWREGDQVRCKTIGTLATGTTNASNKSYWRTIPEHGVSSVNKKIYDEYDNELYGGQKFSWIVIGKHSLSLDSKTEEFATAEIGGIPEEGDTIVLDGHRAVSVGGQIVDDYSRKGVLILESTGENTPRIVGFKGVDRYTHDGKEVFVLSPDRIRLNSGIFEWVSSTGDAMHMVNYRGEWKAGSYAYYDQVNHNNALWTCVNPNGCNSEPKDGTADWQKVLSGEKGEQGAQGPKGETGVQGPQGEKGDQGEKGEQGIKGDKGEDGFDGADGADGLDGTDGISILIERPLVFDTDDTGKVPTSVLQSKKAVVRVMQGGANVSDLVKNLTIDNAAYCSASASVKTDQDSGSYIEVQLNSISDVQTEAGVVSAPCGFVVLLFLLGGNPYRVQVPFTVNVAKYMGSVKATAQSLQTKYTELVRDLSSPFPTTLKQYTSAIQQTAKDIVLSVSKKKAGRRNLLYGTAFTRDGLINLNFRFQPTMTEGVNGMNAVKFSVTASDSFQYIGLFWRGEYGNIPVKRNTDYTFSCWVKSDNPHAILYTERYSMSDATAYKRGNSIPPSKGKTFWRNDGNWQFVTNTFNSGDTDFVEVNVFLYNADENSKPTVTAQAWFCMPMLEEGDEYTGWTLSERDCDYVGGNMLDDTRTLVASTQQSNLFVTQDVTADTYEGAYAVAHGKADESNNNMCDFLRFNGEGGRILDLRQGKNYVFSFLAKGNGTLIAYMYKDSVHASIYSENSQGYVMQSIPDGVSKFTLTSQWKRYWVHWRIDPYTGNGDTVLPRSVLLRAINGCEVWVTKPKLEEGALMTEYTEKKTDLIDKATAKAAGLNITADGVELYGDKVKVNNNGTTAAMFAHGKLNADLIDADTINVHHVWAKDSNNQNTLAHFGNYDIDEAKDEDGKQYPLWVGSSTAADSPFRVSKDGCMYADKGAFGVRYYEDEDSGTRKKFGRFEITGKGLSSGAVFKEDSMMLTDTRFQLIKAEGRSAIFLDTDQTLAVPGPGTYLSAKMRVDAIDTTDGYHSNVCYFAEAKNGVQNYALRGVGDVSVNGGVYGYKYTMINMTTKNVFLDNTGLLRETTYKEVQKIDSLTMIVSSKKYLALALPTLGTIKQILFGSQYVNDKFCVRLTIVMDIGSKSIAMRGRCTTKDDANVAQWNTKDLPLITHWNGGYWSDFDMAEGDAYDFLLTYDPNKSYTLEGFTQPYLARIINRQY